MRRSSILYVAAVALCISFCDAASAATNSEFSPIMPFGTLQSAYSTALTSTRSLRGSKRDDDNKDMDFVQENRAGIQLTHIDDLLKQLALNEKMVLQNLNKFDDDLMRKLRQNPSWARTILRWKDRDLHPTQVAAILNKYPQLSRRYSMEWNAWKIYAVQYLRLLQGLS
ncbi:RXLR domain-containing protein [Phytophthora infestans]|uniref:RxLR effector protein n=1 Tax=Phytophthora infestans TaxID=4787 RepID=A0A833TDV1_PHYIN|nr:RXLR domain-containing protein [Phytophthora infestans]KAF4135291.1 RXLR effector domain-containing protein [Phytophthora infestans]